MVALRARLAMVFGAATLFLAPSLERGAVDIFARITLVMLFGVYVAFTGILVLAMALLVRHSGHVWESIAHSLILGALAVMAWVLDTVRLDMVIYLTVTQAALMGGLELLLAWRLRLHKAESTILGAVGALSIMFSVALGLRAGEASAKSATLLGTYA